MAEKSDERMKELEALNLKGAGTAKKPSWAGKKWKTEYKKGGMVKPPHVGPGTTGSNRDYGK